jgi:hypothetical protein
MYISNLPQRAGVGHTRIRQLVLKELVDNGLDEMDRVGDPGKVTLTQDGPHAYTVTDLGRGFDGDDEDIAYRFSFGKDASSSKQWRKPTRGCVGNGLRVIVASVASGGGRIIVKTQDRQITLRPRLDGTTAVEQSEPIEWTVGAAITVEIDPAYPANSYTFSWAKTAVILAGQSKMPFARKPSPRWLDADHIAFNMLAAIGPGRTLRWFCDQLDRCSARGVSAQVSQVFGKGKMCQDMTKAEASELLAMLQSFAAPVKPKQLGPMGEHSWCHRNLVDGYACMEGVFQMGVHEPCAEVPFLVECWSGTLEPDVDNEDGEYYPVCNVGLTINRSPAIIDVACHREGRSRNVDLSIVPGEYLDLPKGAFRFALNITSPTFETLSDNKTPSLTPFENAIKLAVEKAVSRAARKNPPTLVKEVSESRQIVNSAVRVALKEQVLEILLKGDAQKKASGEGSLSFNQRSLYYVVRESVPGLKSSYFASCVTEYENDYGEIPGMFRSNRGAFYEPHGGMVMPLGTLTQQAYQRGSWTYGTVLICEKEDNVHMLRESGFAERWDCFLVSSSGFTTRAIKDMIDYIGTTDEPVNVYAIVDADAAGGVIFETFVRETKARGARNITVTCLGLNPWEAMVDGLQHESDLIAQRPLNRRHLRLTVGAHIKERDKLNARNGNPNQEPNWENWLQDNRFELNAMTSPQRVAWVERKFAEAGVKKVIPPGAVIEENLKEGLRTCVETLVQERTWYVDAHQELDDQLESEVDEELEKLTVPTRAKLKAAIQKWFKAHPAADWRAALAELAERIAKNGQAEEPSSS